MSITIPAVCESPYWWRSACVYVHVYVCLLCYRENTQRHQNCLTYAPAAGQNQWNNNQMSQVLGVAFWPCRCDFVSWTIVLPHWSWNISELQLLKPSQAPASLIWETKRNCQTVKRVYNSCCTHCLGQHYTLNSTQFCYPTQNTVMQTKEKKWVYRACE